MKVRTLLVLVLAASWPAFAQTTLTLVPGGCGRGAAFNCTSSINPYPAAGTVWIDVIPGYSHLIQFSAAGPGRITFTSTNVVANYKTLVPMNNQTHSPNNSYKLTISSFSGTDQSKHLHSGYGSVLCHYYYVVSSGGKAGGSSGWHLQVDSGSITLM